MAKEGDNNFGVASVVLGILSIVFISLTFLAIFAPLAGVVLGIVGLIFGLKQKKVMNNKWATAGIWLNVIGIIINALLFLWVVKTIYDYTRLLSSPEFQEQLQQQLQQQALGQLPAGAG